jgi:predicted DNA-binding protein
MGKYKQDARYKVISLRITDEEKEAMDALSRGTHKSVSILLREAVRQVLAKPNLN